MHRPLESYIKTENKRFNNIVSSEPSEENTRLQQPTMFRLLINSIVHHLTSMNKTTYNSTNSGDEMWRTHMIDTLDCEHTLSEWNLALTTYSYHK